MKKGTKYPPEPLTSDEVKALINACGLRSSTGIRNRALMAVLFRGGLRISEALALALKDVEADGTIRVLHGKGDKSRAVRLDPGAMALVQVWLMRRAKLDGALFCTLAGEAMQTSYVRGLMKRLARKAGISKRVHCHGLRHGFAVSLLQAGVDVGTISQAMGHSSVVVTAGYLNHLYPQRVLDVTGNRVW